MADRVLQSPHIDYSFTFTHEQPEPKNYENCGGDFEFNNDNNKSMRLWYAARRMRTNAGSWHVCVGPRDAGVAWSWHQRRHQLPTYFSPNERILFLFLSRLVQIGWAIGGMNEMKWNQTQIAFDVDELNIARPIVRARAKIKSNKAVGHRFLGDIAWTFGAIWKAAAEEKKHTNTHTNTKHRIVTSASIAMAVACDGHQYSGPNIDKFLFHYFRV